MNSKGRALDNIFVERFFRTLKYENIYLNEYENPKSLRRGLNQYIRFYNEQRLHESLEYKCRRISTSKPQLNWHLKQRRDTFSLFFSKMCLDNGGTIMK
jgi:putative transposase